MLEEGKAPPWVLLARPEVNQGGGATGFRGWRQWRGGAWHVRGEAEGERRGQGEREIEEAGADRGGGVVGRWQARGVRRTGGCGCKAVGGGG